MDIWLESLSWWKVRFIGNFKLLTQETFAEIAGDLNMYISSVHVLFIFHLINQHLIHYLNQGFVLPQVEIVIPKIFTVKSFYNRYYFYRV